MDSERKQAAKNFLKMLLEQDIPLRVGQEEDRIVLCIGLVLLLDADEETKEIVIMIKDKYSHEEIAEALNREWNPYVTGIISNFDPRILERTRSDSPMGVQEIIMEQL